MSDNKRPTASRHHRGQVGIGTLIILIAAMLVAAMTAGVFLNMTGLLTSKTSATEEDVGAQFSNNIEVVAVTGEVFDGKTVEVVNITIKRSGDEGATDLRDLTIRWIGPAGADTLVYAGTDTSGPTFGVDMVKADDKSEPVLVDEEDRAIITIDPGQEINATTVVDGEVVDVEETGPGLEPGETVTVEFVTEATTSYRILIPNLSDESRVSL